MIIKNIISAALSAAILAATLCACSDPGSFSNGELLSSGYTRNSDAAVTYNYADGASETPTSYNSYANLITGYELKLFRNMAAQGGSFAFSPALNALGLSLLANGAKGDTQAEIMLALGSDLSTDELNACSSYFKSRMESVSKSGAKDDGQSANDSAAEVRLGSFMLVNSNTDVRSSFLQTNADFYGADIARFDFGDKSNKEKVDNLIGAPVFDGLELSGNGSICAVGSASLSDYWLTPYGENDVADSAFCGKPAQFLASDENYIRSDTAEGVIKYTAKNPLKLVLIMPGEGVDIRDYAKTFDSVEYSKLLDSFSVTERVNAYIPAVNIPRPEKPTAMSGVLKSAGLYTLFSDKANFGNLAHSDSAALNELYDVQPGFTLNRYGVFASDAEKSVSAPAAESDGRTASGSESKKLEFSRPFIFMLIDNESNIPVYMGVYEN